MPALDWFESIRAEGERLERIRLDMAELDARISPRAQGYEPMAHGTPSGDKMLSMAVLSARLTALKSSLPLMEEQHRRRVERATHVLYGRSGRRGLAAHDLNGADILCAHYLQGIGYTEIGKMLDPDNPPPYHWCRERARTACRRIDRLGVDVLEDS